MKHLISILAIALLCSGCAHTLPPLTYQYLTTAAVIESGKNSPQALQKIKTLQPVVCKLATESIVDPASFSAAIGFAVKDDREALALGNAIMGLYVGAIGSTSPTNASAARPYAQAVFCDGIHNGILALEQPPLMQLRRRSPTSPEKFPLVK